MSRILRALGWPAAALAVGWMVGRLSLQSGFEVSGTIAGLLLLGFLYVVVAHPSWAARAFLVVTLSGLANGLLVSVRGTALDAGTLLVVLLFVGWALSSREIPRNAQGVTAVVVLGLTLIVFAVLGSIRGHPWAVAQDEVVPALFLLSLPPLLSACQGEGQARRMVAAAGVGIGILAVSMLWLYVTNFNHAAGESAAMNARILGETGLAGGPRVLPAFHRGALFPAGLIGAVLLLRTRGPRIAGRDRGLLTALAVACGLGVLLTYSRSLMITAPAALVVAAVVAAEDILKVVRPLIAAAVLGLLLLLAIPILTGGSVGSALSGLRERFTGIESDVSYTQRIDEDREGLAAFADSPFVGDGLGADVVVPEYPDRLPGYFHNAYVGLLVKTGVIGTGIFAFVLVGLLLRTVREARAATGWLRSTLAAAAGWLVGLMVASTSEPFLLFPPGYQYIALVAALAAFAHARRVDAMEAAAPTSHPSGAPLVSGALRERLRSS